MIHQYKLNGFNIVLDTYSGSVHSVDDVAYDIIAAMNAGDDREKIIADILSEYAEKEHITRENVEECLDDIESLKASGKLFSEDAYKDMAFDVKLRRTDIKGQISRRAFCDVF